MGLPGCLFVCHLILLLMCFLFNSPVHGSSSGALSTGDRCFVTGLAGEVECGSPATILSVTQRPFVTTGLYLRSYHLHAWRLLCSTTKQRKFQLRSLSLPQLLHVGDPPRQVPTLHYLG